jgi:aldose 1-epimerase
MRIEAGHAPRNLRIFTPAKSSSPPNLHPRQIFIPAGANFLCVEPMSHVPDAINRPKLPGPQATAMLAPGDTPRGSITLTPENDMLA